jgi:hypothetical protein
LGNWNDQLPNYPITNYQFLALNGVFDLQAERDDWVVVVVLGQVFQGDAKAEGVYLGVVGKVGDDGLVCLNAKGF